MWIEEISSSLLEWFLNTDLVNKGKKIYVRNLKGKGMKWEEYSRRVEVTVAVKEMSDKAEYSCTWEIMHNLALW